MKNEITLKEESPVYTELKSSSKALAAQVDKIVITDDATLSIARQNLSLLSEKVKEVSKIHKNEKDPYWTICKSLDRVKKELNEPMENSLQAGKNKVLAWNKKVQLAAAAEETRKENIKTAINNYSTDGIAAFDACKTMDELTAVREKIIVNYPKDKWSEFINDFLEVRLALNEYAKSARTRIQTPTEVDPDEAVAIKEAIVESTEKAGSTHVVNAVPVQTSGIRKPWKHELIDITKVPIEWLTIDDAKVKAWRTTNKDTLVDGDVVTGIKFYQEETLSIR